MTDNYDVYNTQNFDIGELIKRSRVPCREEDAPSENKMPRMEDDRIVPKHMKKDIVFSKWISTAKEATEKASEAMGHFGRVVGSNGSIYNWGVDFANPVVDHTHDGVNVDFASATEYHDHNGYIDPNRWDIRLSKALNFISQDEKHELWKSWSKNKFGAIYVIKTDYDLERVIELGRIPNAPKDAAYISSSYDYDTDRFLVKVWSKQLNKMAENECYHKIEVEFFDGDPDCKHERKCFSPGLSFQQSQCLDCGKIIDPEKSLDYVEGDIKVKLDYKIVKECHFSLPPEAQVIYLELPGKLPFRYVEVTPEFLLEVARFTPEKVKGIMGEGSFQDWFDRKYPSIV